MRDPYADTDPCFGRSDTPTRSDCAAKVEDRTGESEATTMFDRVRIGEPIAAEVRDQAMLAARRERAAAFGRVWGRLLSVLRRALGACQPLRRRRIASC